MKIERRVYRTEFRDVPGSNGRQKWATAVTYNTVDEYGTIWLPGVFDEALGERMPTMLYGHDWHNLNHVLGKGIDKRSTPADVGPPGVDVLLEFDDPEFVPMVRQAMWQVDNKTLSDVSVGFERREWVMRDKLSAEQLAAGATEQMVRAGMDELSIVVRGAVLGAQFRSRRAAGGTIDVDAAVELARRVNAGELSQEDARTTLELLADGDEGGTGGEGEEEVETSPDAAEVQADVDAALAEADAALDGRGALR